MTGAVRVTTGTLSHGQSHETTLAQIVADRLGLPLGKVKIVQGDTDKITYGFGSFASRSVIIGGGAVAGAAVKLGEQLCSLAAHLMEIDVESVELDGDGGVRVRADPDKRMSFADLAYVAYLQSPLLPKDVGPGLRASASFDLAADGVFSNATHGVVVELDPAPEEWKSCATCASRTSESRSTRKSLRAKPVVASHRASQVRCSSR